MTVKLGRWRVTIGATFEPHDVWVGLYWRPEPVGTGSLFSGVRWRAWICVVPMLPVTIVVGTGRKKMVL